MKFLLVAVNAKYIHSNPAVYSLRGYAGEALQKHIALAEYTINQAMQDILADIYHRKPEVIGFSCYIWNWEMIQQLLKELPKLLPETDLWLGGPEVTYDAPEILKEYPQLTGVMVGEGEETFRELLQQYSMMEANSGSVEKTSASWEKVAGLCLSKGYTGERFALDMNRLPFLYDDMTPFTNKIIYYESSRGCPYRCSYCLSSIEKQVRIRDISVVKKELQFFLDHQVKQVKFIDRTFNCNHEHAMAIWSYIHEHDNGVTNFHFEISADILREEEIALLQSFRPGLAQLEIGVQTTNPKTIAAIQRVMNVERLSQIVSSIHKGQNIHLHLDLIAGLPYEDYESFGHSFDQVYAMHPEQLQLGFLKVLKGSEMHNRAEEFGIRYLSRPPYEVLSTNWLSFDDIIRLKRVEEMVELYYNSNQYTHTLAFLVEAFDRPFTMYEAMAQYFQLKGYFVNSPARAYRYQILLDFAENYDERYRECYRELLTYDVYLREKSKSRPGFAAEIKERYPDFAEFSRDFYQQEEQERRLLKEYEDYDWKQMSKMTQLEPFRYPVWDEKRMGEMREREKLSGQQHPAEWNYAVLFQYQKRNPLTYEAEVTVLSRDRDLL